MKTPHFFLLGFILLFSLSGVQAQDASPLSIGLKTGYNFNQFSQPGTMSGVQAGGYLRFAPTALVAGQLELLYDMQGGGRKDFYRYYDAYNPAQYTYMDYPIGYVNYSNRYVRLHTVSVPLSVRISAPSSSNVTLSLIVGGSFDYIFGAREYHDAIYYFNEGNEVLISDRAEKVVGDLAWYQISAHIGAALDFALDNGKTITYEMRYRKSFTDINETVTATADLTESLYATTFSLSVYYPIF